MVYPNTNPSDVCAFYSRALTPSRPEICPSCPGFGFSPLSDRGKWASVSSKVWPDCLMSSLEWFPSGGSSRLKGRFICGSAGYCQGSHFAGLCVESLLLLINKLNPFSFIDRTDI